MTDCRACTRPTPDQAVLCATCGGQLAQALGDVPALVAELELVLARQTAYGDRVGGRGADKPLPYDQDASVMLAALRSTLSTWARVIRLDDPWPADTIPSIARWLLARLERIRQHEAGEQLYDEITALTGACWRQVDRPVDRVHVGACGQCDGVLRLAPGDSEASCTVCRRTVDTEDLRAYAEEHLGTAAEVTRLLRLLGHRIGTSTVRQWALRGRLQAHATSASGDPMYRVGDVITLLAPETRAG